MKLPDGWCEAPLEQLAESSLGKMLDKGKRTSGTPLPYLRNINVRWGEVDLTELYEMPFEDRELERYGLRQGDVLICEGGEPGRCAVWLGSDKRIMYQKAIHRVRPHREVLDGQYLQLHIRDSAVTQELDTLFTGTTIKHLTGTSLAKYVLRLPPLNEQRRIVDKIEALTARSRRAKEALDDVPALLDKLRQSILAAAFRGDLTKEWRAAHPDVEPASVLLDRIRKERRARWEQAELARMRAKGSLPKDDKWKSKYVEPQPVNTDDLPELPEGWAWASLDEMTIRLTSGSRAWSQYYGNGTGTFIMAQNVRLSGLDLAFRQAVNPPALDPERARTQVEKHDVLITIVGANTGDVCVVPSPLPEHYVCQSVALIRCVNSEYSSMVCQYLQAAPGGRTYLEKCMYGQGRPHLSFDQLRVAPVPVPPQDECPEVERAVAEAFARLDSARHNHTGASDTLASLNSSILAKAFRGELVPQDPNDEPASALLERIRAERESSAATTSGKKPRAKRTAKASKGASR